MSPSMGKRRHTHPHSRISSQECRAMRALSDDDDYSLATIAFMFECKDGTVVAHTNGDCSHDIGGEPNG